MFCVFLTTFIAVATGSVLQCDVPPRPPRVPEWWLDESLPTTLATWADTEAGVYTPYDASL